MMEGGYGSLKIRVDVGGEEGVGVPPGIRVGSVALTWSMKI
jgi:hypothetical protein